MHFQAFEMNGNPKISPTMVEKEMVSSYKFNCLSILVRASIITLFAASKNA